MLVFLLIADLGLFPEQGPPNVPRALSAPHCITSHRPHVACLRRLPEQKAGPELEAASARGANSHLAGF